MYTSNMAAFTIADRMTSLSPHVQELMMAHNSSKFASSVATMAKLAVGIGTRRMSISHSSSSSETSVTSASPNYDDDDDDASNAEKPTGVMDNPEVNEVAACTLPSRIVCPYTSVLASSVSVVYFMLNFYFSVYRF